MPRISDAEVRRLLSYLKAKVDDESLAVIEDELRGDEAEEYLREPDLLEFFPELSLQISAADKNWNLRIISHAHLRMVQRGVKSEDISDLFRAFAELQKTKEEEIFVGHYALFGRLQTRRIFITLRIDIDKMHNETGEGHVVTIYIGRGNTENSTEVDIS